MIFMGSADPHQGPKKPEGKTTAKKTRELEKAERREMRKQTGHKSLYTGPRPFIIKVIIDLRT